MDLSSSILSILCTPLFASIPCPSLRVLLYRHLQYLHCFPKVSVPVLCTLAGTTVDRYYRIRRRFLHGLPISSSGRFPILNTSESFSLEQYILESISRRCCPTLADLSLEVSRILCHRQPQYAFGERVSESTLRRWLTRHGFILSPSLLSFDIPAKSDRYSIMLLYHHLHELCRRGQYPDNLIFNMDETWVATEEEQPFAHVVHTADSPPFSFIPPEGKHISLIACISKSADEVPSAYILPKRLVLNKNIDIHNLRGIQYWFNNSGFLTKSILISWLQCIFIPHVNSIRLSQEQHALLICDAHTSRYDPEIWNLLKSQNIDMLVLPAHVTSVFQPLDLGVFRMFKKYLKECKKLLDNAELLKMSVASFRKATTCIEIDKGWNESKLFISQWKEYADTFPEIPNDPDSSITRRSRANYVVSNFDIGSS